MKNLMKVVASLALVTIVMATTVAAAGTGSGSASGMGKVNVNLTVSGGQITDVTFDCSNETLGLGDKACETLAGQLKGQSGVALDTVSGATVTSEAFKKAATAAYEAAVTEVTTTTTEAATTPVTTTTTTEAQVENEPTTEAPAEEDGLNVGLIGGIIALIAVVGFFGFSKFGPKE